MLNAKNKIKKTKKKPQTSVNMDDKLEIYN